MSRKILLSALAVMIMAILPAASSAQPSSKPSMPRMISWGTLEIGSSLHLQTNLAAEAFLDKFKFKIRLVPFATDTDRAVALRSGGVQVATFGGAAFSMQEGKDEFADRGWGPQPVQALWMCKHPGLPLGVRGDSDIRTLRDLKGKKVPFYIGSPGTQMHVSAHLAFADLTYNDVIRVDLASYGSGFDKLLDKSIDVALVSPTAPKTFELKAAPGGVRYLEMPAADKAGWERARRVSPLYVPVVCPIGAGLSEKNPIQTKGAPEPVIVAYQGSHVDTVYFLTKAYVECFESYAPKGEIMKFAWPLKAHWELFDVVPFALHEGAVRYYREIGQWSAEREAKNKERIKHQADLKALWDAASVESLEKKVRAADFPKFWMEKRKRAGFLP